MTNVAAAEIAASLWTARRAALSAATSQADRARIASEPLADAVVTAWRSARAIPARATKLAALELALTAIEALDAAAE